MHDERTQLETSNVLDHALIGIAKRFERPPWTHTALRFDLVLEFVFGDSLKSAVGVVNEHDLAGLEVTLGNDERADDIVSDDSSRIANDMSLAMGKSEDLEDVHATVHARNDSHVTAGDESETVVGKR